MSTRWAGLWALVAVGCSLPPTAPHNTALTPDTHTPNFPINIDGGVHTLDCNVCHGDFDSFSQFTCTTSSCHSQLDTDASHGTPLANGSTAQMIVPGYSYSSTSCYECHPQGVVPPPSNCTPQPDGGWSDGGFSQNGCFDHTPFFLIRPGQVTGFSQFSGPAGPHDGCSPDAVLAIWMDAGVDLNADNTSGSPMWITTAAGAPVQCPPYPNEGGILCSGCHPDSTNHKILQCSLCHPTPAMQAVHDAGIGFAWVPDDSSCWQQGCHQGGGLGFRPTP
jgi:hypothetical protein